MACAAVAWPVVDQGFANLLAGFGRLGLLSTAEAAEFGASSPAVTRRQHMLELAGAVGATLTDDELANAVVRCFLSAPAALGTT